MIKTIQIVVTTFMVAIASLLAVQPAFAQIIQQPTVPIQSGGDNVQGGLNTVGQAFPGNLQRQRSLAEIIHLIINWALYFAAVLAVLFIIYGGYLYLTSAGDATQAKNGRAALVNALIGLVLVVLSYLIVQGVYRAVTEITTR